MSINIELNDLVNLQNETTAVTLINKNSETIEGGFTTALNTTGDQMLGTLDMNSNNIINLPTPATANSPLRLQDISSLNAGTFTNIPSGGSTGDALVKKSNTSYDIEWSPNTADIAAGTGITTSSSNPTVISIANTAVTAGSYGSSSAIPVVTVNAQGQLTGVTTAVISAENLSGTTLNGTILSSSLTSLGPVTSLTASTVTVTGNLTATGSVVAASGSITNNFVAGTFTTGNSLVNGNLTVTGNITVTGSVVGANGGGTHGFLLLSATGVADAALQQGASGGVLFRMGTVGTFFLNDFNNNSVISVSGPGNATTSALIINGATSPTAATISTTCPVVFQRYTVTSLPSGITGARVLVTDSTVTTFGSTVAGGSTNVVPVFYTGSAWHIG